MERAFSKKKKDIWREQSTEIRRCDYLNNPGKGGIVSEKVILLFIGYDLGMVGVKVVTHLAPHLTLYPTITSYIHFQNCFIPPPMLSLFFLEFIKTESRREENKWCSTKPNGPGFFRLLCPLCAMNDDVQNIHKCFSKSPTHNTCSSRNKISIISMGQPLALTLFNHSEFFYLFVESCFHLSE